MKWIKQMYYWVLHWAETPYGPMALFFLAFLESSVFPIPPDVLLIALCLGIPKKGFQFATVCAVGSVLGGLAGYWIGYQIWDIVGSFFLDNIIPVKFFNKVLYLYNDNAFLSIFISGFTPIPYKAFTISAGVFKLNLFTFVVASALGRSLRFFLVAGVIYKFGAPVKSLIEKYFEIFTILFSILLIGGFILIKFFLH